MVFGRKSEKPSSSWSEGDVSSGENVTGPKQSKIKRVCSKWWWLFLLLLIIIIVLIVIPIIFVAIPKKVQETLNSAETTVDRQVMTNPLPNSFDLQLNTTVKSNSDREAKVDAFNASFYLLDTKPNIKPFVYAQFPAVSSSDTKVNVGQRQQRISNLEQFSRYTTLILNSETFSVGVRGHTHVRVQGLPKYGVEYDQVVTMKGFDKLKGFNIDSFSFHTPPLFDGATMTGRVSIPNPSVITCQFGNVSMNLFSTDQTFLGTSLLTYVEYKPGDNTYDMRGYVNTTLALQYVQNSILEVDIIGNSSVNILGQHLTYFEEALKTNTIRYRLDVSKAQPATASSSAASSATGNPFGSSSGSPTTSDSSSPTSLSIDLSSSLPTGIKKKKI